MERRSKRLPLRFFVPPPPHKKEVQKHRMRFLCWYQRTQGQKRQKIFVIHKSKKPSVPSVFLSFCLPTADSCFCVGTKGHKVKSDKRFLSFTKAKNLLFLLPFCPYVFLPQIVVSVLVQKDARNKSDKRFLSFTKAKNLLFLLSFCPYVFLPQNAVSVLVQKDTRSKATKDFYRVRN